MNNKPNPKGSHIYKTMNEKNNTTPTGSNLISFDTDYKHIIPSGLKMKNKKKNPKGSHIYKTMNEKNSTTPTGSNLISFDTDYKHIIPSGLRINK